LPNHAIILSPLFPPGGNWQFCWRLAPVLK
jgi:hypothetical protein